MKNLVLLSCILLICTNLFGQTNLKDKKIIGNKFVGYTTKPKIDSITTLMKNSVIKNDIFLVDKNGDLLKIDITNIPNSILLIQEVYVDNPKKNFFVISQKKL